MYFLLRFGSGCVDMTPFKSALLLWITFHRVQERFWLVYGTVTWPFGTVPHCFWKCSLDILYIHFYAWQMLFKCCKFCGFVIKIILSSRYIDEVTHKNEFILKASIRKYWNHILCIIWHCIPEKVCLWIYGVALQLKNVKILFCQ